MFTNTMTPRAVRWHGLNGTLVVLLLMGGCGGPTGPVRGPVAGKVTVGGAPLKSGVIRFLPTGQTNGPAAVATIKEGTYVLDGEAAPVVGTHRVEIEATDYTDFAIDDEKAYAERAAQGKQPIPKNPVAEVYNKQSQLTAQVPQGGNRELDFRLEFKGVAVGGR